MNWKAFAIGSAAGVALGALIVAHIVKVAKAEGRWVSKPSK